MASTELDEETRRLIKLFRPAKDAETSWRIDVSAELAWYLDMLQQNDTGAAENVDEAAQFNQGLASVIAYEGINFSQASAVVMEATRVFSRKVEFLRKQMDSTLTTILTGAAGGQGKKAKQRRQRAATLGAVSLPEWEIPDIPDSAEFMHLPLEKLTGFREYTEDTGKHILPLERHLHKLAPAEVTKRGRPTAASQQIQNIVSEDEIMLDELPEAKTRRSPHAAHELTTTSASDSGGVTRVFPVCHNLREIAIIKKQVFSRPTVHLLAPCQINPTLSGTSFHFELFNFFKTHATTRATMGHSGLLSFTTYRHLFDSNPQAHSSVRFSFSPRIGGGGDCGAESVQPGTNAMPSQALSAHFGGTSNAASARLATKAGPAAKPKARPAQEPEFHDEHEAIGKDAPTRVGATTQKINVQLYNQSLEEIRVELLRKKEAKDANMLDCLFMALTGEYGIERLKYQVHARHLTTLPFFTDIKRPAVPGSSYYFDWNLPPKERANPAKSANEDDGAEVIDESPPGFGDDLGDYMGDELDEARAMNPDGSVMYGGESVMLVDTFSRLDNRLSIINQANPGLSVHGSVNILSQMHERIGIWRQRVEQWMTVAANEESFDIPKYVQRIRMVKQEHNKAAAAELALANASANPIVPNAVSFREVCKGAKRHEVCRLFLTSLLLVNRYGLEINPKDVNDFSIDLDRLADEDAEL